jgi:transposase InsO family protein
VQRLVRRYQQGGERLEALCNQPRGCREPIVPELRELIVECKLAQPRRSLEKIRQLLEEVGQPVSRQTVWRVLAGRGLANFQEPEPLVRFVHAQPNDLWQLDLMEDEALPFGKTHLVAALDDHSRFCVGARFVRHKGEADVLGALAGFLQRWGMPAAILTDRAVSFYGTRELPSGMTTYQLALSALGIRAAFAKPYKPRTKGKIERFFSFLQRDFLAEVRARSKSLEELNGKLDEWLEWYNSRRPHGSLGEGTPGQHYRGSQRAAPPQLAQLLAVESPRRVDRSSTVAFRGKRLAVPPEYLGQRVWLQLLGEQLTITAGNRTIAQYSLPDL